MDMRWFNWIGFIMLVLALLLNELFLGMNTWYELNFGAVVIGIVYLAVATALSLWPGSNTQHA